MNLSSPSAEAGRPASQSVAGLKSFSSLNPLACTAAEKGGEAVCVPRQVVFGRNGRILKREREGEEGAEESERPDGETKPLYAAIFLRLPRFLSLFPLSLPSFHIP